NDRPASLPTRRSSDLIATDGKWSFDTSTLSSGAHNFTATATDFAGNTGNASAALSVIIDTEAPAAPAITGYSDDSGTAGDGVTRSEEHTSELQSRENL